MKISSGGYGLWMEPLLIGRFDLRCSLFLSFCVLTTTMAVRFLACVLEGIAHGGRVLKGFVGLV